MRAGDDLLSGLKLGDGQFSSNEFMMLRKERKSLEASDLTKWQVGHKGQLRAKKSRWDPGFASQRGSIPLGVKSASQPLGGALAKF
jgi:hypothetical protein